MGVTLSATAFYYSALALRLAADGEIWVVSSQGETRLDHYGLGAFTADQLLNLGIVATDEREPFEARLYSDLGADTLHRLSKKDRLGFLLNGSGSVTLYEPGFSFRVVAFLGELGWQRERGAEMVAGDLLVGPKAFLDSYTPKRTRLHIPAFGPRLRPSPLAARVLAPA
jgi:hypothetical protein